MKKFLAMLLVCCLSLGVLAGCGNGGNDTEDKTEEVTTEKTVELTVFAAASMTETLTEIAELYKEVAPEVEVVFNFDSSGTLKTQIEEGAACDVFISASPKQMNELDGSLDKEKNPEELDFLLQGTRVDLLENKVALVVSEGNPAEIYSFDDVINGLVCGTIMLAIGNQDVPVGQYTEKIFAYLALTMEEVAGTGCVTFGSNVKEVTTQVAEGIADCGIVYATDAYAAGLTIVDTATEELYEQVIYPAAVLNITEQEEAARAFLEFLKTEEAGEVFEKVGFTWIGSL